MFKSRVTPGKIAVYAARYAVTADREIETVVAPAARERGFLTVSDFYALCDWKSPRSRQRVRSNPAARVEEATRLALSAVDDGLKAGILQLLEGVSWPTASVILHWCDRAPFPILDYRALWTLGLDAPPAYTLPFWASYVAFTRALAAKAGVDMRTLDQGLWQYSKEHQPPE